MTSERLSGWRSDTPLDPLARITRASKNARHVSVGCNCNYSSLTALWPRDAVRGVRGPGCG